MSHKDLDDLLDRLRSLGDWTVELRRHNHWKITNPSGVPIFTSGTPSDYRALANLRAQLRRAGAPREVTHRKCVPGKAAA